jgi:hypothetical protein
MALIEISNIYNSGTAISAAGRSRLAIMGELIVAVDLINTVAAPGSALPDDLLSADRGAQGWWRIEKTRLPGGDLPDIRAVRRLRSVLRDMIEALVDRGTVPQAVVSDLNRCGSRSPRLTVAHPTCSASLASVIHDRSSMVFPLPGGADSTVTRANPSRPHNPGRETTPPAPGPAARRTTDTGLSAGRTSS